MRQIIDFGAPGTLAPKTAVYPETVEVPGIFCSHEHPRDTAKEEDGRAEWEIPQYSEAYEDILGMGNTKIPLISKALAKAKGRQWRTLITPGSPLRIHVAGLMHEGTDPLEVVDGYDRPLGEQAWLAMKMFIRSASNAHGADVDDVEKVLPVIRAMSDVKNFKHRKTPMVLPIHAERKWNRQGNRIYFLNREAESIDRDIELIYRAVPNARVVICHVKGKYAVDVIRHYRRKGFDIWGEICFQYTHFTTDDLFEGPGGGTACDVTKFCLPIFGTPEDRDAVDGAMLSGEDFWIFGKDGACHVWDPSMAGAVKLNNRGIVLGGQTQIIVAVLSAIIERFVQTGKQHLLPAFLSGNGRRAFGLPDAATTMTFHLNPWEVPDQVEWDVEFPTGPKTLYSKIGMSGMKPRYHIVPATA